MKGEKNRHNQIWKRTALICSKFRIPCYPIEKSDWWFQGEGESRAKFRFRQARFEKLVQNARCESMASRATVKQKLIPESYLRVILPSQQTIVREIPSRHLGETIYRGLRKAVPKRT